MMMVMMTVVTFIAQLLLTKNSSVNLHDILHLLLTKTYETNILIPIFQVGTRGTKR